MYTLVGSMRTRALRVGWILEELGLEWELRHSFPQGELVREVSDEGKIPVLLDGDVALRDSVAIMTYLADKHGGLTYPAGTLERAIQDGHTQFLCECWDALLWTASKHSFVFPEDKRLPGVKDATAWEFRRSVAQLEARYGDGPYLMGEALTVPDLLAAHCHRWATNLDFPQPSAKVTAYLKGLRERDAFKTATAREPES